MMILRGKHTGRIAEIQATSLRVNNLSDFRESLKIPFHARQL